MEELAHLSMSAPIILITIFALCISLLYMATPITRKGDDTKKRLARGTKTAPVAGGSWPLLGHLPLLGGPLPAHLVLAQTVDKYGPIFTIRLGLRRAVVVDTWELAKECLTTNDRAFATRPRTMGFKILTYKYAMLGVSPYGPYWRQQMILVGTDTTTVTMTWALSLLLNKEALKKIQQELDAQIGKEQQVKESDLQNLPYLQAIIKETLRLYPVAPLSVPHKAIEDSNISGYFVPRGTQLLLNPYKIQRDPRVWRDPSEFRPERFLTTHKDFDVRGHNFDLIPFGSGRRMCPGISLALQVIGLTLASFLHAFDIQVPGDEAIDMEEAIRLTNLKASPLEVLVSPRVPECVY